MKCECNIFFCNILEITEKVTFDKLSHPWQFYTLTPLFIPWNGYFFVTTLRYLVDDFNHNNSI